MCVHRPKFVGVYGVRGVIRKEKRKTGMVREEEVDVREGQETDRP